VTASKPSLKQEEHKLKPMTPSKRKKNNITTLDFIV